MRIGLIKIKNMMKQLSIMKQHMKKPRRSIILIELVKHMQRAKTGLN